MEHVDPADEEPEPLTDTVSLKQKTTICCIYTYNVYAYVNAGI